MKHLVEMILMLLIALPVVAQPAAPFTQWPPREYLLKGLVDGIEPILKTQDLQTGRFGTKPWICSDQNVLLPLAAAWSIQDPANPWYHSDRVLTAIAKGGEALVDDQDAKGMWIFRKKDNSTWGQIHMPWTYSRWIRAYVLVKDALSPESRAKWEQGLLLGFKGIRRYADGGVHNIPTHHAMALYIAGVAFNNEDWKQAANKFMSKVVAKQDPGGFWSENFGPVVGYNEVYVDALGVYYAFSRDPQVLEALQRSAKFHSALLWPDGSSVACVDERQVYHAGIETGTVGFTWTPEGRGYLLQQLSLYAQAGRSAAADYAAGMLLYSGTGEATMPAAAGDRALLTIGNNDALVQRCKPWQWAISTYACPVPNNRWIQDRHNLLDVFADGIGLVIGGGNTKLQPYWSTFTVGDCSLLQHDGSENPKFIPEIALRWVPDKAKAESSGDTSALSADYGDAACKVSITPQKDQSLRLRYEAPAGRNVEAHVPFLYRKPKLTCASGRVLRLDEQPVILTDAEIGGSFVYGGLKVTVPAAATLRWPMRQHNPYTKDGHAPLNAAKLVLCLPFTEQSAHEITLSHVAEEKFKGTVLEARQLTSTVTGDGYTKPLNDLGSQLLGMKQPGASLTFKLPELKPGRYELFGEFVYASMYGIINVSVDGQVVGQPADLYWPGVDDEGERISFGMVTLKPGPHEITMQVTGKSEKSTGCLCSVKRWLLRPVK